jgi:hypothetical protein
VGWHNYAACDNGRPKHTVLRQPGSIFFHSRRWSGIFFNRPDKTHYSGLQLAHGFCIAASHAGPGLCAQRVIQYRRGKMSKELKTKKETKKKPALSMKEKKAAKRAKKEARS